MNNWRDDNPKLRQQSQRTELPPLPRGGRGGLDLPREGRGGPDSPTAVTGTSQHETHQSAAPASPERSLSTIDNPDSRLPPLGKGGTGGSVLPRGNTGGSDVPRGNQAQSDSSSDPRGAHTTTHGPTTESSFPPLARGDQGGFEKAMKEPAPAIHPTETAPQPPNAPTPSAASSPPRRTHKPFGGGPWQPRIDPEIEDAEDRANPERIREQLRKLSEPFDP